MKIWIDIGPYYLAIKKRMKNKLSNVSAYALMAFAFFIPLSVFVSDILLGVLALLWFVQGDLKFKIQKIKSSSFLVSIFLLMCLYAIGMLWGVNHGGSAWVFEKTSLLLIIPVLYTSGYSQLAIKRSILAFLISIFIISFCSALISVGIIQPLSTYSTIFPNAAAINVIMPYNYHNVYLAFSIPIAVIAFMKTNRSNVGYIILAFFLFVVTVSLFSEKGRAGHVLYFLSYLFLVFYFFKSKPLIMITGLVSLMVLMFVIYSNSSLIKNRFDNTLKNTESFTSKKLNNISIRYYLVKYSMEKIALKPLLGYGTGSFVEEFSSISEHANKVLQNTHKTPHNNFIFIWFEVGLIGLVLLMFLFYAQIKSFLNLNHPYLRIVFPVLFIMILFSDNFLQNHDSAILYAYLSFVYGNYSI